MTAACKPGRALAPGSLHADTLLLDFRPLELHKINAWGGSGPGICDILLWQLEPTKAEAVQKPFTGAVSLLLPTALRRRPLY